MHSRKYNECRLIMSRRLTLREACSQLGFVDELSIDDYDDNNDDAEEFIPVEDGKNDKEIVVDDEENVEIFEEIDDNDTDYDNGASTDENANADQSDEEDRLFDCIPSRSISYTTQEILNQRRRRNTLTQTPRAIATLQTECESFEHMITKEIMQIVLR